MMKRILWTFCTCFFAISGEAQTAMEDGNSYLIKDSLQVESIIPVYINRDTATLLFKSLAGTALDINVSFKEQYAGAVPASPMTLRLNPGETKYFHINISAWKDGEYKTIITSQNDSKNVLVRGIRKQTKTDPVNHKEITDVKGQHLLFPDDIHLSEKKNLTHKTHPAELLKVAPWEQHPVYERWRNRIEAFGVNPDGSLTMTIDGRNRAADLNIRALYHAKTTDFKHWEIVSERKSTPPIEKKKQLVKPKSYRFYDPDIDGKVDLSEVIIRKTGFDAKPRLGDISVPRRSMFAIWHKPNGEGVILQRTPITEDKHIFSDEEIGEWTNTNDNFGEARLYDGGKTLRFYQARLIPRHDPFRIHYDNVWATRTMVIWSSNDGINWTPEYFNPSTQDDVAERQDYGVDIFKAGLDLEIAYHRVYEQESQRMYTEVVYSRDGKKWNRFDKDNPFMGNSAQAGDWNFGFSMTTPIRSRAEHDGYYYEVMSGINTPHLMFLIAQNKVDREETITMSTLNKFLGGRIMGEKGFESSSSWSFYNTWDNVLTHTRNMTVTSGLIKYRKDGWVSVSTQHQEVGSMTTKVFTNATTLKINARTENDGFVKIEVLDAQGKELTDYCGENAAVFKGDAVQQDISWKSGAISTLPQRNFKLRISMSKADLYTLYF